MKTFIAAVIQMRAAEDPQENLRRLEELVRESASRGARLVCGPEFFLCPADPAGLARLASAVPGPLTGRLGEMALRHSVHFVPGTIPERREGGHPYNTLVAFGPDGALIGSYRKRHLFHADFPGAFAHDEREYISAGKRPAPVIDTPLARLGTGICYDLRFPEQFLRLALDGAEVIVAPSAFMKLTAQAHWHVLCRARAIETGCYLLAPDGTGASGDSPERYGHSLIVDPWGAILAEAGEGNEVVFAELSAEALRQARARLHSVAGRAPGDSVPEPT